MALNEAHPSGKSAALRAWGLDGAEFLSGHPLSDEERELLNELVRALRTIRFGSIALTIHDGRLVEIHKTEKIRR